MIIQIFKAFQKLITIYFLFLFQFKKNNIPIAKAGPAIISDQESPVYQGRPFGTGLIIIVPIYNNPNPKKATAPKSSCFHAIIKNIIIKKLGIKCINNATTHCNRPLHASKTSRANKLIKSTNKNVRTLGVQNNHLFTFLFLALLLMAINK